MTMKRITSFVLLLCVLLSMFTLPSVGAANVDTADTSAQTDIAGLGATVSEDTIIYFDASNYPVSGNVIQFMIGHDSWSQGYPMKKVSNSNLYYVKMPYWDNATQYAIFGCNEEWGGEYSSVSSRKNYAPWATSVMSATNLSGTAILTANSSGILSKSSASLNTTHTATAYYRKAESGAYTKGTTGGTVSVSGYNISGSTGSAKSSSTSGTGISAGIGTTVTMKASAASGYIFQGWYSSTTASSAESTKTTYTYKNTGSAKTLYARFQLNESYTVTFLDWDGSVLATRAVAHGGSATAPEEPSRPGYTFTGWDKSFSNITADTIVTAKYSADTYKVTFKDWDGTVLATKTAYYGFSVTAPSVPGRSGYEFTGWDKSFATITSNLTVTAQYKDVRVWLPGSFNNWDPTGTRMTEKSDGTVSVSMKLDPGTYTFKVYSQNIWYGNGGTIEDTTTATSSVGWEMVDGHDDCTLVASGGTYTFTFNKSTRMLVVDYTPTKYTVTFKNWDGTVLSTQSVASGKAATAPSVPSREATAQYSFKFTGWDKDFSNVKSNITVTAQFDAVPRKYTVTFEDWDGTVLATRSVEYGGSATPPANPTRESDSQYAYTFSAWSGSYTNITKDTVVTAVYVSTTNRLTVTFKDWDGTVLATRTVAYGGNATPPQDPEREGYTFAGWDGKYTNVTADTTVVATYTVGSHIVTFIDYDGKVLKTQQVGDGGSATAPEEPTREGYTFAGWDKSFSGVTADITVTATYTINRYTVTFKDYDGKVIATRTVNHGSAATAPTEPVRGGYAFTGWDKDFSNVTSDLTVTAQYREFTVVLAGDFNDWSETSGKMTASSGNVYTTTLTLKQGEYAFKVIADGKWYGNNGTIVDTTTTTSSVGWEMSEYADNCTLEALGGTYTFTYNSSTRMLVITYKPTTYSVTFKGWDGTVLKIQNVEAGKGATAPTPPQREGYVFTGWDKDFSKVTANITVTAKYSATGVYLTGDFNGWSNTTDKMTASGSSYTTTINLKPGTYKFKVIADGEWYGNEGTIEDTTTATSSVGWEMNNYADNCTLEASGGAYTFTFNTSSKMLIITYKATTYTVTFVDWNGVILKTQTVNSGKSAEAPEEPTRAGYNFAGWDKDFSKVVSDLTVNAQYSVRVASLTGDFNSWNPFVDKMSMTSDNVYEISLHLEPGTYTFKVVDDNVWYGNAGVIENTTATTSSDGWEMYENADNCTLEAYGGVYTFRFNVTTKRLEVLYVADGFVVTFKDHNGTTLKTQTVNSSTAATAPADPYREGYTFAGWDTDFSKVTANLTVTALYNINSYTIVFRDWDGTVLSTENVVYGAAANAPTAPSREGYVFKGWDTDCSFITGDATITAVYDALSDIDTNVYLSGTFNDWSKNTVMTQSGDIVTTTLELEPGKYLFKVVSMDVWYGNNGVIEDTTTATSSVGWEMSEADGDCTLKASGGKYTFKYNPTTRMLEIFADIAYYTVTFTDYDGTVIDTQTVKRGASAVSPEAPVRETDGQYTYTFAGWDKDISNIQGDTTVTATYIQTLNKYTVTFVNDDGTVLKTEEVEHGSGATAPEAPTKEGSELCTFTFAGWDVDFSCVTADMTVTATYTAEGEEYTVTFVDWDGTVLSTQSVVYSTSAIAPEAPVREGDEEHSYVFSGWDKDFSYVTEDMTVTAVYTLTVNVYTVNFVNYDGSVLKTQLVAHGAAAEAPDTPSRPTTAQFRFTFDGWDTDFSCVTSDLTVKATYTASVNGSGGSTGIYNLSREVQRGQILQCWCWSYNNIRANLQTIASQGFSAIQVSPVQPLKENTNNGWNTLMNSSWVVYQPVGFTIERNSGNAMGTKSQFEAMCREAHKYGIKVIVDVVLNHTANDYGHNSVHPFVDADLKNNPDCWHDISRNISNWNDRYDVTHHCLSSLPDLNTAHPTVQWHCANLLKECIAAGADGFRFDAAKHIETDWDADGVKSDFWMNVLGEATAYAQSTRGFTPYYYGEVLGSPGGGVGIGAYTRYMSITETGSNSIRNAVCSGNASGAVASGLHTGEGASKAVMYTETHDTYKDDGTRFVSDENINKTWAVLGSRANVCGLYMARPYNIDTTRIGAADKTAWASPAVKAVNQFKNHFVGQGEYLSSYYNLALVERGNSGVVIVNVGGSYYNGMSAPVHTMADGSYMDSITGNIFNVSGGWISGDIGDTGIAVIYKDAGKGTFTAGTPTDFSLVGSFNDWDAAANKFVANDDKTASTVMYLSKGTYSFKLTTDSDLWFSNSGTITDSTNNSPWSMEAAVTEECKLVASGGKYTFTFNSISGKLSVDYQALPDYKSNMYLKGTFNDWGTGNRMSYIGKNNIVATSITLTPGTYNFKLNDTGYNAWYSNKGTINDTTASGGSSGWDMTIYDNDDCTLVATGGTYTFNFNMSTHKLVVLHQPLRHTVVFKDYDGRVLTSQIVEHGSAAMAPDNPERAYDGTRGYIFSGWDKEFSSVTEDLVITAQYTSKENSYAVIFKDFDGRVISSQLVEGGGAATAPESPVRAGNAQYTYEFAGWDTEFTNITADTTINAKYNVITNQYAVIFKDFDGTVITTSVVDYGTSAVAPENPTREANAQYSYEFSHWSNDFSNVTENMETVAVYKEITNQYTVRFVNWDGSTISTQSVNYGWGAQAPAAPVREGYLFTGWDKEYNYITTELTVNATFSEDIVYLKGDFNGWGTDGVMTGNSNVVSVTLPIQAGWYGFKLQRVYYWYSNGGTIYDTTTATSANGWGMSTSENGNCTLAASGGYYTFRFDKNTAYLEILYTPFVYTVTFKDYDGTVLKTEEVDGGKSATAPAIPEKEGYAFTGWDVAFDNIRGDLTVTATYQQAGENEHIVTFKDFDGTTIAQVIAEDGQSAVAPEDPTRESDAQYTYTFSGWDTDFSKVTADMTVTATYEQTVNSYNVIFKDHDGTVLSEQVVEYGKAAVAPEAPAREGDDNIAYSFKGWDKEFTSISGDLTITALYDVIYTKYTVTFVNWDGSVISKQEVDYSKSAVAPEAPGRNGYLFTGWDADFSYITGDLTVNATFAEDIVYVKGDFNGWSSNDVLKPTEDSNVVSVTIAINPGTYGFKVNRAHMWYSNSGTIQDTTVTTSDKGWGMSNSENGNCTLVAFGGYYTFRFHKDTAHLEILFEPFVYTVTFKDFDGTVLKTEQVERGKAATAPDNPIRNGYVFTGWDVAYGVIYGDTTITATYRQVEDYEHIVTFKDYDGTILSQMIVEDGNSAVAPDDPVRAGDSEYDYVFKGWDVDFSKVTSDLTVTAVYTQVARSYKVTFVNYDGTVISEQKVKYGKSATAPNDPVRQANAQYTFTFAGWDTEFTNVTSDLTVKATYTQKINEYTVVFQNWNGIVLSTQIVEYGKAAVAPKDPTRQNDEFYEYTFNGWDKDFTNITGNLTVTAQFTASGAEYMVVFLDMEGNLIGEDVQYVMHGQSAVAPEPPEYEGYVFTGWDTDYSCIVSDTIIFAEYAEIVAYLPGDFNDWNTDAVMEITDGTVVSSELVLEPGTYEFKIIFNDTWYGNDGTIEDTTVLTSDIGWEMSDYAGNCTLEAMGGTYTFAFNTKTRMLTVTSDVETYTVTFLNQDGTVLATEVVRAGADAEAPAAPTMESTMQCRYVFRCWDADFTNVSSDMTVTALYDVELIKYTVTFTDYDGTVLSEQLVEYGSAAEAPAAPERDGYCFTGWDKDITNITGETTVTAQYMEDIVYLNGDFNNWASDIMMTATETQDIVTAALELNEGVYEFQMYYLDKWYGNIGVVDNTTLTTSSVGWEMTEEAGNCKLNAIGGTYVFNYNKATRMLEIVHVPIEYTVTFKDYDGAVLKTEIVERGKDATPPTEPTRDEYMFTGWDAPYTNVKADTVVNAIYLQVKLTYTVTFLDWDGTILKTEIVNTGEGATAPEAPEREGYKFIGWNKDFSDITYNLYVHATYEDQRVLLAGSFTNWLTNIELKKTEEENVYSGEVLLKSGKHHFKVFHKNVWFGNIGEIEDTTITTSEIGWEMVDGAGDCALIASGGKYTFNFNLETRLLEVLYTPVEYTVTFISTADEVVSKQIVRYGGEAYAPEAPVLEGYNFIEWDTDFTHIEADTTVRAIYAPVDAEFTVKFVDWNGTVLATHSVAYGGFAMPPTVPSRNGYVFIGWDKNFTYVTGDLTVTARYMVTTIYLSGEFNDWNEEVAMTATADSAIVTYEITVPKGEYEFKIIAYDVWYGNDGVIEDTTLATSEIGWAMQGYKNNCTLKASGGKYRFNFNPNTATLEVLYTPVEYTVTFVGLEGKEISMQKVKLGDAAVEPEAPAVEGYKFVEWDTEFNYIDKDLTVTAKYKKIGASGAGSGYNGYNGGMPGTGSIVAKGLDLSAWQEDNVNFEAFKAEGYSFVILRAGTSKGKDKYFETYYSQAKAAGLYVGAYYYTYATTVSEAVEDANHFLSCISGKSFEYPIYLDYETEAQWNLSAATSTAICQKFMGMLEDKGYLVGMYTGAYNFRASWITDSGIRDYYEGWVAHYASTNSDAGYSKYGSQYSTQYGMYQFTDKHYITHDGVKYGPYDANIAYKDYPAIVKAYGFNNIGSSGDITPVEKFTVNFVDYDGTVISTQEVEYGEAATAPKDPEREGYIFVGWDKKFDKITGKLTVIAQYKDNQVYLAGSFNDWNRGFYLEREGDSSVFSVRIVFLEGTHYFKLVQGDSWYTNASTVIDTTDVTSKEGIELRADNDLGEIILNASGGTYTFKFDVRTNKLIVLHSEEYISNKVTFVNWDGTVISEQDVYINNAAVAPETPVRPNQDQYAYVFNGWDVDFSRVSSDMTVTATYLQKLATYTVTFVDSEGTVLGTSEVEHGFAALAPEVVAKEGEIFIGWDKDISSVTSDLTVTAVFISEGTGEASNISLAGTFNDWNSSANYFSKTSNDDIVVAKMELKAGSYQFKIVNDGNWLGCDTSIVNTTAGCTMSGSAGNCNLAASGGTYTFVYYKSTNNLVISFVSDGGEIVMYTVTFADTDGTIIAKQMVLAGGSATAPAVPAKDGYVFVGWDKEFTNVTEDITVTAKYTAGTYSSVSIAGEFNGWNSGANYFIKKSGSNLVTLELNLAKGIYKFKIVDDGNWLGNNGVIVDKNSVAWGMDGAAGDCVLAASGGTYTFQYNTSQKSLRVLYDGVSSIELPTYTVTFKDWNGIVLDAQKVELGSSAIAPPNPSRGGSFTFGGWDADFGCVKGDMTVTAYYIDNSVYLMGINGDWTNGIRFSSIGGSNYRTSVKLGAGQYGFKIKHGDSWYGNNGWIEDTTDYTSESGWEMSTDTGDCVLNAIGSTYTFTFNTRTRMLKITYVAPIYTVTFKNYDGKILDTQSVKRGDAAKAPKVPEVEGRIFIGWDRDFSWVYETMTVTATFADDNINLMGDFNNWSGTKMSHFHDSVFIAALELKSGTYGFKMKIAENWLGNSGTIEDTTTTTSDVGWELSSNVGDNCTLKASGGVYVFMFDVQTKMIIITHGTKEHYEGVSLMGDFSEWADTEMIKEGETTVYTSIVELEKGTYKFKLRNGLTWVGFNGTVEDGTSSMDEAGIEMSAKSTECVLIANGGTYRFTFDTATNRLIVERISEATGDEATFDEATIDEIYELMFNESDTFKVVSDADVKAIPHGGSFSFTIEVAEGYLLNAVVYNMTILTATDGVFTIDNITSDAPVIVVVIKDGVTVKPMEFTVIFADKDGNALDTQIVAYGNAAVAPEAPAVAGYNFTGWDTEFDSVTMDIIVKATYKKIPAPIIPATTGKLEIITSGGTGFTIAVNGGNARPQGAAYSNAKMPIGASVTLVANTSSRAEFLGWANESGAIVSTNAEFTFVTSGNDYFRAVYQTVVEGVNVVIFKNSKAAGGNGQILDMQYYAAGDKIEFPTAPAQSGYNFTGWSLTVEDIEAELSAGKDVVVTATWEIAKVYIDVTLNGGKITTAAQANGKYIAYAKLTVVADTAPEGQKFAYWANAEGKIMSYDETYTFFPAVSTELTAVYLAEDAEVQKKALVSMAGDPTTSGERITYSISWDVDPSVGKITNYGLLIVDENDYNEDTFYHGSGDSKLFDRAVATSKAKNSTTIAMSNRAYDHTYKAVAFVIYTDAITGESVTVYSDVISTYKQAP